MVKETAGKSGQYCLGSRVGKYFKEKEIITINCCCYIKQEQHGELPLDLTTGRLLEALVRAVLVKW